MGKFTVFDIIRRTADRSSTHKMTLVPDAPDKQTNQCLICAYKKDLSGTRVSCESRDAQVVGLEEGYASQRFMWPYDFDPIFLVSCTGYLPVGEQR